MTNASIKNLLFALSVVAIAAALSLGAFATTVNAETWSDYDFGGDGWSDYNYDSFSDYNYDSFSDYNYDSYSDYNYDTWSDYNYDSFSDYEMYDNDYETYGNDYETYGNDYETYGNDYETYNNDYETYANDYETYNNDYETYYDESCDCYESAGDIYEEYFTEQGYGQQSFAQQSIAQAFQSVPQFAQQYMPQQYRPQTPSYPTPRPQPQPQPTPVCPQGTTGQYPNCRYPQPTPVPQPQPVPPVIHNTNTNTNINTCVGENNCNTNINNIDNSINGSFNSTVLTHPNPQPIVQYQYPVYQYPTYQYPTYIPTYTQSQAPYCVITISQGANGTVYLTWSSQYATSAYITPSVGQVAPNGSTSLYAYGNSVYTLTVYGPGGSYICRTQTFVNPVGPTSPYVSLTQIPYTGLSLGPIGNAIYWMSLISLAVAGAYLLVYYKGGMLALASMKRSEVDPVDAAEGTIVETPVHSPVQLSNLPVTQTRDAIRMTRDENGTPRLVISRS